MLDINIEYVNGILFIKLDGKINSSNSNNIEENILNILQSGGIKYLFFNLTNLVLEERVSLFDKCNSYVRKNGGKLFICGYKFLNKIISSNYDSCSLIKDELFALKELAIC